MTEPNAINHPARRALLRALAVHAVIGAAAIAVAAAWFDRPVWVGAAAGAAIGAANLAALAWLAGRITSAGGPARLAAHALLIGKLAATLGAVATVFWLLRPSPIAFAATWTSAVACLVVALAGAASTSPVAPGSAGQGVN